MIFVFTAFKFVHVHLWIMDYIISTDALCLRFFPKHANSGAPLIGRFVPLRIIFRSWADCLPRNSGLFLVLFAFLSTVVLHSADQLIGYRKVSCHT